MALASPFVEEAGAAVTSVWLWSGIVAVFALGTGIACSGNGDANSIVVPPASITLSSVSPATISARGGALVTLRGSGFAADTKVKLGDQEAEQVKLVSASELDVTAPPLWAGVITVEASGPGGTSQLANAVQVTALDLRFVQAPTYSLTIADDLDAGADAAAGADAGPSPSVNAAVTDDLDGDGDVDMVSCATGEACHFLANDGQGNFQDTAASGDKRFGLGSTDARVLAIADLDGDGDRDLVLAPASGGATIETNDGKARFTETALSWAQYGDGGVAETMADGGAVELDAVSAFGVGDLDGDGKLDLVVGNAVADQAPFRILRNVSTSGAIRFEETPPADVPARDWAVKSVAVADVDGDGQADLVLATPGAADGIELRLLLGKAGVFTEAHGGLPNVVGADVSALAVADVNGDGFVDVLAAGKGQDRLLVNDGSGHFFDSSSTSMPLDDTTASSIALVDLDRDHDLDLVIGNHDAVTRLYLNDGKGVFHDYTPLLPLVAADATWVAAADVDGDSDQDIFIVSATPTIPRLYLSVEQKP